MSNKVTGNEPAYAFDTNFEGKLYRGMTLRQKALLDITCAMIKARYNSDNAKYLSDHKEAESLLFDADLFVTAYIQQLNNHP